MSHDPVLGQMVGVLAVLPTGADAAAVEVQMQQQL